MLEFFRKYQTYFFVLITTVIVISFSFFGTANTIPANSMHEQVVFTAVDGTDVTRRELEEITTFIGSDNDDKMMFGGVWGPNFLNDGVVSKDFLATGLANILVEAYPELVAPDLDARLEKEKRYNLYVHPQANFIGVEGAWAYMMPEMKQYFDQLQRATKGSSKKAFQARVDLFLGERQLPPHLLRQILKYQQKQFTWLTPDQNLERVDLSLFGYHTLSDWFGPRFMRVVAEFIINAGKVAEEKGYRVSKEEALVDLHRNAEISFRQNLKNPHLGVSTGQEYFQEQLRRLGMDQTKAVRIWQQVLLFRRLFQDVGLSVFTDPLSSQQFFAFVNETVKGDLYRLPAALHFGNYHQLQKFEIYLQNTAKNYKADLLLPTEFLSVEQVKKKAPALVERKYTLLVAQAAKKPLQARVSLKETWNWEVQDQSWEMLKKEFPILGIKAATTADQRMAALDSLDDLTRSKVDVFARNAIVETHPEWLTEALQNAEAKEMKVGIRLKGGRTLFGLDNREALLTLLNQAPLASEQANTPVAKKAAEQLAHFTGDQDVYYRITVMERAPQENILTFAEANQEGVLDQLLDRELEAVYAQNKEAKNWKVFADVKNQVADLYFDKILSAIRTDYAKATPDSKQVTLTGDRSASLRFYAYARHVQQTLAKGEQPQVAGLANQWQFEQTAYQINRSAETGDIESEQLFAMAPTSWLAPKTPVNGDLYFFYLQKKGQSEDLVAQMEKLDATHQLLSHEAQQAYMQRLLQTLKAKHAISLDYMDSGAEIES